MSQAGESTWQGFGRLWRRAPLWRLTGMSAAVASLLFSLGLAQQFRPPALPVSPADNASYVSQTPHISVKPPTAASETLQATAAAPMKANHIARIATGLVLAGATASNAGSPNQALYGRGYSGSIRVMGYQVPLPAGEWFVLANLSARLPSGQGEFFYLGKINRQHLVGGVRISAVRSLSLPGTGVRASPGCITGQTNNIYTMAERVIPYGHQACWIIQNYYTPPMLQWADRGRRMNNLERAAAGDLAAKGVEYPQDLLMVRFTRSETWGTLEVGYLFSPEAEGIHSAQAASYLDSDWHPGNIEQFPQKLAYVTKLETWATPFWSRFKQAFEQAAIAGHSQEGNSN